MGQGVIDNEYVIFGNKRICWNNFFLILFALGLMIGGLFFPDEVIKAVYPFDWFPLVFKILCFMIPLLQFRETLRRISSDPHCIL